MDPTLKQAYLLIFGKEPEASLEDWELAKEVITHWDVPKLGESLAQECIFRIVNHISFPDRRITREIVGEAEEKATELFPELEDRDPHMAVIERLEYEYRMQKEKDKERKENKIK